MKKFLIITTLILLYACKQREESKPIPANMTDTIVTENEKSEAEDLNEQLGDTIQMTNRDAEGDYTAIGQIDSIHPRIYVKFINTDASYLNASITTMQGDGNIRFNQIIFPDKTMDGPFGNELEHELDATGQHTLIIGHSLMAEDMYEGKFKIDIKLSAKN